MENERETPSHGRKCKTTIHISRPQLSHSQMFSPSEEEELEQDEEQGDEDEDSSWGSSDKAAAAVPLNTTEKVEACGARPSVPQDARPCVPHDSARSVQVRHAQEVVRDEPIPFVGMVVVAVCAAERVAHMVSLVFTSNL